MPQPAEPAK